MRHVDGNADRSINQEQTQNGRDGVGNHRKDGGVLMLLQHRCQQFSEIVTCFDDESGWFLDSAFEIRRFRCQVFSDKLLLLLLLLPLPLCCC